MRGYSESDQVGQMAPGYFDVQTEKIGELERAHSHKNPLVEQPRAPRMSEMQATSEHLVKLFSESIREFRSAQQALLKSSARIARLGTIGIMVNKMRVSEMSESAKVYSLMPERKPEKRALKRA